MGLAGLKGLALNKNIMANDKGHLVNIEKVEYNTYSNVDTAEILSQLNILKLQNSKIMAKAQEQFDALMDRLNTVTNDIAADYQKLLDEIQNNTVSPASIEAAKANIEKLEGLGASVENPVPEEPPVEG